MHLTRRRVGLAALSAVAPVAWGQGHPASPLPAAERAGYLLVMGTSLKPEIMQQYAAMLPPIYDRFGGYYVASGRVGLAIKVLEGRFDSRSVILARFPTVDAVNEFWWSPEYRLAANLRLDAGAGRFTVLRLKGRPGEDPRAIGRPAHMLVIETARGAERPEHYDARAGRLLAAHGGQIIAGGERKDIELLEGEFGDSRVVIVRFKDLAALRGFHDDPAYRRTIRLPDAVATSVVLEIDGPEPRS